MSNPSDIFNWMEKSMFSGMGRELFGIRTDILEQEGNYLLRCELPGFSKEDINIDIKDNCLTVSAQHKQEEEVKQDNYLRRERKFGSFSRSFDISNVQTDQISAKYENGVLELTLPKQAEDVRKIEIN